MIGFTLPWALVGLVAAALPLLLHLVQRHEAPEMIFPALRYLQDATRDQQKRMKFRHWLLLIVRTLLIVALVFAAAGATMRRTALGAHAPSALVLVVDNSAASGMVIDGETLLVSLVRAAGKVLDRATLGDRLWLVTADGMARAGSAAELRAHLAALHPQPLRLDLGRAVANGRDLLNGTGRRGEVVVVSALQRSALSGVNGAANVLVLRPAAPPPVNRAIVSFSAGLQPWSPAGGRVTISVISNDTMPVPVTLSVGGRTLRDVLVTPGVPSVQRIGPQPPGWLVFTASLPPDEFRLDDSRSLPVRVAPPAVVDWNASDRYLAAAAQVLATDGRIHQGKGIQLGALGSGASVVLPPDDAARVGALNRALAARGIGWRFGALVSGTERTDSGANLPARETVTRRHTLERAGAGGEVLATVSGAPWLVRSGDVVLLGSRMEPEWSALPLSASFVPFLDAVLTGTARGDLVSSEIIAGERYPIPERITATAHDGVATTAEGGAPWTPATAGAFYLISRTDTVGAVAVHLDARVSTLARASDREVRDLWPGAVTAKLTDGPAHAFATGARGDLRGFLLLIALACVLVETLLTGGFGPRAASKK